MINWSPLRREALLLKTGKWFRCCHWENVTLMKWNGSPCGSCLLIELLNCTFLLKIDSRVYCCHAHLSHSIITIILNSVAARTTWNKIKHWMILRFKWDATRPSYFKEPDSQADFQALLFLYCLINSKDHHFKHIGCSLLAYFCSFTNWDKIYADRLKHTWRTLNLNAIIRLKKLPSGDKDWGFELHHLYRKAPGFPKAAHWEPSIQLCSPALLNYLLWLSHW